MILPTSWLVADQTWGELRELAFRVDPLDFLDMVRGGTDYAALGARATIAQICAAAELAIDLVRVDGETGLDP